jgi:hypothetical protein
MSLIGNVLAENRDLLTYRYIEKLSQNIRVMLVPTDAPLILPLDQIVGDTDALSPTLPLTETPDMQIPETTDTVSAEQR